MRPPVELWMIQILNALAMPNDRFVLLALPVSVAVGENDPAGTPVIGARNTPLPDCRGN